MSGSDRQPSIAARIADRLPGGDVWLAPGRANRALWRASGRQSMNDGEPSEIPLKWGIGLGLGIGLDELVRSVMRSRRLRPTDAEVVAIAGRIADAREVLADRGWLADPTSFHRTPPPPDRVVVRHAAIRGTDFEHLSFESGYEPDGELPARDDWLAHESNRTARAMVVRHSSEQPRPWLVALHGFSMGAPSDLRMFGSGAVRDRGVNVIHPIFPLHGERSDGKASGDGVITLDAVANLHGLTQAVWDTRRCIAWARAQGATRIGVHGMSLGGYTAALLASVADDIDSVIVGVAPADLVAVLDRSTPWDQKRQPRMNELLGDDARDVHRVVSPLAMAPRVPRAGRFVYAGIGDRMATPQQAEILWRHWDRPEVLWFGGSHVSAFFSLQARRFARRAVYSSLLGPSPQATDSQEAQP